MTTRGGLVIVVERPGAIIVASEAGLAIPTWRHYDMLRGL